jgi:hypothetical protein
MFGRERPRRTYRVYAEDDFFGDREQGVGGPVGPSGGAEDSAGGHGFGDVRDPGVAGGFGDAADGADRRFEGVEDHDAHGGGASSVVPPYTAPRRTLPGPLEGRLGVVLLALVAMAISALAVHLLRASLEGGEVAPRPSLVASGPPASASGGLRVAPRGDARIPSNVAARAGARVPSGVAHNGSSHPGGAPWILRRDRLRGAGSRATSSAVGGTSNPLGPARTRALLASSEVGAGEPASEVPQAVDVAPSSELPAATPEFGFER